MPKPTVPYLNADVEAKVCHIADLTRDQVIEELLYFPGRFKLDFTRQYLQDQTDEQLRHMLMAAYLYADKDSNRQD